MYEILLEGRAERDLKKLPAEVFNRIVSNLKALAENPKPPGSRKITGSKNDWRIRIGDIVSFMKSTRGQRRLRSCGFGIEGRHIANRINHFRVRHDRLRWETLEVYPRPAEGTRLLNQSNHPNGD